jgi:hypothetical protein
MPQRQAHKIQYELPGLVTWFGMLGAFSAGSARCVALVFILAVFAWNSAIAQDADAEGDRDALYLSDFRWTPPKPIRGVKLYYTRPSNRAEIVEHDLSTNQQRLLRLEDRWDFLCLVRTDIRAEGADEVSNFGVAGCNSRFDSVSVVGVAFPFRVISPDPYENDANSGIVEMGKLLESGKNDHLQLRYRPYSTPLDQHFYDSQSVAPDATSAALTLFNEFGPIVPVCRHFDFQRGEQSEIGGVTLIRSYTAPLDVAKYHMWHVADNQRFQDSFQKVLQVFLFDRNWKSSPELASTVLPCRRAILLEDGKVLIEADEELILLDVWARTASILAKDAEEPIAVRVLN